jgi:hypothetical protein
MLDYHGDAIALAEFLDALAAAPFADPILADAQQEAIQASTSDPGAALLGALYGQLLVHAASDGVELDLLDQAAGLWAKGLTLCQQLAGIRADLEHAMENPTDPGSADSFNSAAARAQTIGYAINALRPDIDALRAAALAFPHLPPHPRQDDKPIEQWDWGNLLHARRTDALARDLLDRANSTAERAFALGVVAGYGANSSGSGYLGQAVGGPRRSQRYRDRLARNSVGAWLAAHHPQARPLNVIAATLPAELPEDIRLTLNDALSSTFDRKETPAVPDLDVGYDRLLRHLALLTQFTKPPVPVPPGGAWQVRLWSDPSNPPPSLRPQDVDVVGQDGGGVAVQYGGGPDPGSPQPGKNSSSDANAICGIIAAILIIIDVIQAFVQCIVQWANKKTCTFWDNMLLEKLWEQDPPDPHDPGNPQNTNVTAQQLAAAADNTQAAQLVSLLFDAHNTAWEAMDRAYNFLASTGLIMPEGLLGLPLYAQFVSLPPYREDWPRRPEKNPVKTYHLPPTSPVEYPVQRPSLFPTHSAPDIFVNQATNTALAVWAQNAGGQHDTTNLDLDADRGFNHPCWRADGSIDDDPVSVDILHYVETA